MSEANVKDEKPIQHSNKSTRILILGSGFAGVEVLKRLQGKFRKQNNVDITLVSRDNFLLFTPLGNETNFFGMEDIKRHSFTMKTVDDAIILRNHILNVLEQANIEQDN